MNVIGAASASIVLFGVVAVPSIFLIVPAWITLFPPSYGKPDWPEIIPGMVLGTGIGIYAGIRFFRWLGSIWDVEPVNKKPS
ncbi:hypothetical protein [Verrucomicrobium sp. BvORR106]|uniref:hypothetical protein n=1 Tax=Verrucomicrobium sp. BvORR106 TaxID=1403819 RepID=UPI00056FC227|nr:hypothetical protein [Verrucomicrobium sp. BvORR106]